MESAPMVFVGTVMSVEAIEDAPKDDRLSCQEGEICRDFDRWTRTGDTFIYNCTLVSCGDCSPPCPELHSAILDATVLGGPPHICRKETCPLDRDRCGRLLRELEQKRPARSDIIQLPLKLPLAVLRSRRDTVLHGVQDDLLQALNERKDAGLPRVTRYDFLRMDLVPSKVEGTEVSMLELCFHSPTSEEVEEIVERLFKIKGWSFPSLLELAKGLNETVVGPMQRIARPCT